MIVEQLVDAETVRKAAMNESEACRWARSMTPNGDGTATVHTHYVRSNPFGRRNAEGVSLQFCSKELRERIAGRFYVELDIKSSHPTMLRTRLARLGKRMRRLYDWAEDKDACAGSLKYGSKLKANAQIGSSGARRSALR